MGSVRTEKYRKIDIHLLLRKSLYTNAELSKELSEKDTHYSYTMIVLKYVKTCP